MMENKELLAWQEDFKGYIKMLNLPRDDYKGIMEYINEVPSAQPDLDEWCTDCKEYDKERNSCPRWNRVIRETLKDMKEAQPEIIRCKDCKHSEHWYRDKRRCFLWHETGIDVFEDGYCNYAERKDNG